MLYSKNERQRRPACLLDDFKDLSRKACPSRGHNSDAFYVEVGNKNTIKNEIVCKIEQGFK